MKTFRFFADLGALGGTGVVTSYFPKLKIFGIFKVSRVLRIGKLISRSN